MGIQHQLQGSTHGVEYAQMQMKAGLRGNKILHNEISKTWEINFKQSPNCQIKKFSLAEIQ